MKTLRLLTVALLATTIVSVSSCKGKKNAPPAGEVEVKMYCSGPDYWTNKKTFRANAVGESTDQATSMKKARANAKAQLAGDITTVLKGTTDNYVKSSEFNNKEEVLENFESLTREVINQELAGIKTICEKQTTLEGKYKTYVAIELSTDNILKKYTERMTKNESLKIDYNYEKFKETFEKEMEKMAGGN